MRVAVVSYPGSNCEAETLRAIARAGGTGLAVWHRDASLQHADAVVLPGGFSYGDYLRCGAVARFSPIMEQIAGYAEAGRPVLGICNGFQILCEAGLLPGALVRNAGLHFISRPVDLRIERTDTPFTHEFTRGDVLRVPVGHGEGRYVAAPDVLRRLELDGQVVLRYAATSMLDAEPNPNGTANDIAGISNSAGNVVGFMPHPERLADPLQGSGAGLRVFTSLIRSQTKVGTAGPAA